MGIIQSDTRQKINSKITLHIFLFWINSLYETLTGSNPMKTRLTFLSLDKRLRSGPEDSKTKTHSKLLRFKNLSYCWKTVSLKPEVARKESAHCPEEQLKRNQHLHFGPKAHYFAELLFHRAERWPKTPFSKIRLKFAIQSQDGVSRFGKKDNFSIEVS